jgi:uncharacterized RDD family membrane protein YckC
LKAIRFLPHRAKELRWVGRCLLPRFSRFLFEQQRRRWSDLRRATAVLGKEETQERDHELSTFVQPHMEPAWKQEVSRCLAAHKSRKGAAAPPEPAEPACMGSSRAAQVAARVAARYAKAPSYSQMQAEEARIAVRAAEIATQVALEAQAAAESALAEMHAASFEPERRTAVVESITRGAVAEFDAQLPPEAEGTPPPGETGRSVAQPEEATAEWRTEAVDPQPVVTRQVVDGSAFELRWEPDMPLQAAKARPASAGDGLELSAEDWWTPSRVEETLHSEPIAIESPLTHANLIEFPRALVATRRMRPRLLEAPDTEAAERQLNIFEVDPGAVSTLPPTSGESSSRRLGPEWSDIELDEHPLNDAETQAEPERGAPTIHLAPMGRRMMALAVDGSLVLTAFFGATVYLSAHSQFAPSIKAAELMAALGVALTGFLYQALFIAMRVSTPGMRYAGIALCTFDEAGPTRAQLWKRLGFMLLSLAPVGLGVAWSLFDEDHLSWHDRISQTYLRKR